MNGKEAAMDWSYINQRNMLVQTILRLLSLAFMAEQAAFGSRRERRDLLDIVRLAEGAGLRLACGYGYWDGDTSAPGRGYSPHEAARLAQSLRAIASALSYHVKLFDQYSAAQRAWIENFSLEAISRLVIAAAPSPVAAEVPLIDTS